MRLLFQIQFYVFRLLQYYIRETSVWCSNYEVFIFIMITTFILTTWRTLRLWFLIDDHCICSTVLAYDFIQFYELVVKIYAIDSVLIVDEDVSESTSAMLFFRKKF